MKLRIATRGSKLALWQANHVKDALLAVDADLQIELVVIKTKGDKITDRPLAKIGGKALFVKEIEQALLDDAADLAVHSMKDVPAELAPGLQMAAISAREDPRDALCTRSGVGLDELPQGFHCGTSSLRRQCHVMVARPDARVSSLRGNVPTRLGKLDSGEFDAIILAAAGLTRLGFGERVTEYLSVERSLPAVGQGVLGLETRAGDEATIALVRQAMHDEVSARRVTAERAFLRRLGGSCQTPLAAYALGDDPEGELDLRCMVGRPDGSEVLRDHRRGPASDAAALGIAAADTLLAQGAKPIIDACEAE